MVGGGRRVGGAVTVLGSMGLLATEGRVGGTNGLISVGSLLCSDAAAVVAAVLVAVGRAAGAAAGAEHPEDGGSERESNCEPSSDVDVLAQVYLNTVDLECCAEGALCDGEHDGRGERCGQSEEERNNGDNGSDTAAPAAEDGEDTKQDLGAGGNEGDEVGDEHPLGDGLVNFHDLLHAATKLLLKLGLAHAQNRSRVEVELSLRVCAGRDGILAVGRISLAVTPETNVVEISNVGIILQCFDGGLNLGCGDISDTGIAEEICDFCCNCRSRTDVREVKL